MNNARPSSGPTESEEQSSECSLARTLQLEKCHLYRDPSCFVLGSFRFLNFFLAGHLEKMIKSTLRVSIKHESRGYSVV